MSKPYLDFIQSMSEELPAIVAGEETTVDRLMLAAGVCGWIMDAPSQYVDDEQENIHRAKIETASENKIVEIDQYSDDTFGITLERAESGEIDVISIANLTRDNLAEIGRACLKLAAQNSEKNKVE